MGALVTIFVEDLNMLIRSWLVWIWFFVTAGSAIAAVMVSASFTDTTSFILAWGLTLYVSLGSFVIIVIAANAASGEMSYLGESIMSRGLTPGSYILAKLTSRLITVLALFLSVTIPATGAMLIQGEGNDLTLTGTVLGLTYVSLALSTLVLLTVLFSSFINNMMLTSVIALLIWYVVIAGYALTQINEFSPDGLLGQLPRILQGNFQMGDNWPILVISLIPIFVLGALSVLVFQRRDL